MSSTLQTSILNMLVCLLEEKKLAKINDFKMELIKDFGGEIVDSGYIDGWWKFYLVLGGVLGGIILLFLGAFIAFGLIPVNNKFNTYMYIILGIIFIISCIVIKYTKIGWISLGTSISMFIVWFGLNIIQAFSSLNLGVEIIITSVLLIGILVHINTNK